MLLPPQCSEDDTVQTPKRLQSPKPFPEMQWSVLKGDEQRTGLGALVGVEKVRLSVGHKAKVAFSTLRMLFSLNSCGTSLPLSPALQEPASTRTPRNMILISFCRKRATDLI